MRVLCACEESQAVTTEFRRLGHEAYSCDLLPTSGAHPEWHVRADAVEVAKLAWDMVIAFPPCTHLACSGARWFGEKRRDGRQQSAIGLFLALATLDHVPRVAVENPVGIMSRLCSPTPWRTGCTTWPRGRTGRGSGAGRTRASRGRWRSSGLGKEDDKENP